MGKTTPNMTIARLLELLRTGHKFEASELEGAQKLLQAAASGKVPEQEQEMFTSADEFSRQLFGALDTYKNTPEGKQFANDILKERAADRFVKRYKPFFNAMLQGGDLIASLSQIRQANKAARNLVPPAFSAPSKIDPALNQSIAQAQNSALSSERALAPVKQEIRDVYRGDINRAAQTSGGQVSTFQAQANAASLRRLRAASALPATADAITARNQARVDNLLGLRTNALQQSDINRYYNTRLAQEQFNNQQAAIGALGSVGRTNLRNTLSTLPENLLGVAARMIPVSNPHNNTTDIGSGPMYTDRYNGPFGQYERQVDESLAANMKRIQALGPQKLKF